MLTKEEFPMRNLKFKTLLLASSLICIGNFAYAANTPMLAYKNQRGSIIKLRWQPQEKNTGILSGTFTSAVGDCHKDMNVPVPISGFYNGNAITISINFPHCKQVVAMTGNVNKNKTRISTIWLDAHIARDPQHKDWNTNLIGRDLYKKEA